KGLPNRCLNTSFFFNFPFCVRLLARCLSTLYEAHTVCKSSLSETVLVAVQEAYRGLYLQTDTPRDEPFSPYLRVDEPASNSGGRRKQSLSIHPVYPFPYGILYSYHEEPESLDRL